MSSGKTKIYFVENLTPTSWLFLVLTRLLPDRWGKSANVSRCYALETTPKSLRFAQTTARLLNLRVEELKFRQVEVRDESGMITSLQIRYNHLAQVQAQASAEDVFQDFLQNEPADSRLPAFLAKNLASDNFADYRSMLRAMLEVRVAAWQARQAHSSESDVVLFMERRPWLESIEKYASQYQVKIVPVKPSLSPHRRVRRMLGPNNSKTIRHFLAQGSALVRRPGGAAIPTPGQPADGAEGSPHKPLLAVQSFGQFNLDAPEQHSDLTFWQQSDLSGSNILVTTEMVRAPLDQEKWTELKRHDISAVALHPKATTVPEVPVYVPSLTWRQRRAKGGATRYRGRRSETRWLRQQTADYSALRAYWGNLFERYGVKLFLTWYKYDGTHFAIADALQELGGITALYQRAYEPTAAAQSAVAADIFFGFSQASVAVERESNSRIPYHIIVGYIGDHRFLLVNDQAQKLRKSLQEHGAECILAFFDENSLSDDRWVPAGHEEVQQDYRFVLEQVLHDPKLGLVIKPKAPNSLRQRLGAVADLLEQALATGRCFLYEEGVIQSSTPPAQAALAADLAVHSHVTAATAGVEAALAGVPTVLLDRDGFSISPLYGLGLGRVIFTGWDTMWDTWTEHRKTPEGVPGFGDWSPMINELDPFRDGRAAERMGTYLKWLIEGLSAGQDRETVMAEAAERYAAQWGPDKINEVKPNNPLLRGAIS